MGMTIAEKIIALAAGVEEVKAGDIHTVTLDRMMSNDGTTHLTVVKKAILATKVGMTQIFNEDGTLTPVTVLQAGPCVVTQIKTVENDGYEAVQVGFVDKKDRIVNKDKSGKKEIVHRHGVTKAEQGHFAKAGVTGKRFVSG